MTQPLVAASPTLLDLGTQHLVALSRVLGYPGEETRAACALFRRFAVPWGGRAVAGIPPWSSDITDDHTPFEFSLAIEDGTPELRFLTEAQAESPSIQSNWHAARALNGELARDFGVELSRLAAVEDLFVPSGDCPRFAMWHAVCLPLGKAPEFKIYLNPQARGPAHAPHLVQSALARLGLGGAHLPALGADDELRYVSLDLCAGAQARVKIYIAHHRASAERIEAAVSAVRGHSPGRATAFCRAMSAPTTSFEALPILTCLSFVSGNTQPTSATVHVPVRAYAESDQLIEQRVLGYMSQANGSVYRAALEAFAHRSLSMRCGMQTYVSLRMERERMTVYLAPEAYTPQTRRTAPVALRSLP